MRERENVPYSFDTTDDSSLYNILVSTAREERGVRLTVPEPNISNKVPSSLALTTSGIVMSLSEIINFSGNPSSLNGLLGSAWARARVRIESRVTPGRIMSSNGGVTSSVADRHRA